LKETPKIAYLDYVFVLRPILFFPGWSTMLAGFFIAWRHRWFFTIGEMPSIDSWLILRLMILFAAAMGACFLLNQLQDVESDKRNSKLFIIAEGCIGIRAATTEVIFLMVASLTMAYLVSIQVALLTAAFIFLTGYLYNYEPIGLKNRPWGSLAANAMMGWLAFAMGWSAYHSFRFSLFIDSLPYLFFNTALYFFTTLPDMAGDAQSGKRTLAVVYGVKYIIHISVVLYILSGVFAFALRDNQALFFILLSMPFFAITCWLKDTKSAVRTTKFSILFFALAVCLKWPVYLILMIVTFFFTRWYFKRRFGFDYPNFRPS
jgi:4-hydroxybenzoate polyprenyltransferase